MKTKSPKPLDDKTIDALMQLSHLMDRAFVIPGTKIRFGLDSVLGLLPFIGDTLGLAISGYIYTFAKKTGVPFYLRLKMIWNIFIDWLIGIIPFAGDIFDVGWKANSKNVTIIAEYHKKQKDADVIEGDYTKIV
jgi:hypothetical protein